VEVLVMMMRRRWLRCVDEVVRRQAPVEMDVSQNAGSGQSLKGPVDRGAMNWRLTVSDLVKQDVGRQMLTASRNDAGQQRDARLRDSLSDRTEEVGRLGHQ
jgi:hypothetical protein